MKQKALSNPGLAGRIRIAVKVSERILRQMTARANPGGRHSNNTYMRSSPSSEANVSKYF
jgi:hypothetical protein